MTTREETATVGGIDPRKSSLGHLGARSMIHDPADGALKLNLVKARGSVVWDDTGKEYIDCTSQAWCNNLGANDPRVVAAAIAQIEEVSHVRPTYHTPVLLDLNAKLREISPGDMNRVGYCLHGSTAGEMAMKIVLRNRSDRKNILVLEDAYHGRTLTTMAASWPHTGDPFASVQPRFVRVPHPYPYRTRMGMTPDEEAELCLELLEGTIARGVDGGVAAVMMEPIQGNGGHVEFPRRYYEGVREVCDRHDILLIWDEIQTGFGRMGAMFAADYYGVTPDVIVFGKGIGGGFPLAGILASERLDHFLVGDDQLTFGQFPPSLAAALATVQAIQDDDLCRRATEHGSHAMKRLNEMAERHELIGDVRCPGLMVGIEMVRDRVSKEPARSEMQEVLVLAEERGVLFGESRYGGLGNFLKVKPPLDIEPEQLDRALDVLDESLTIVEAGR
jgi:4-aminobutyrate aminotransferase-like enzyme